MGAREKCPSCRKETLWVSQGKHLTPTTAHEDGRCNCGYLGWRHIDGNRIETFQWTRGENCPCEGR